jgi:LysM repeat protein
MCGHVLDTGQRRRFDVPVADLLLIIVVLSVAYLWWTRGPQNAEVAAVGAAAADATPSATATSAASPTPRPPTATPTITVTPTAIATPTPVIYVVVRGDTVEAIAKRYGVSVQDLMTINDLSSDLIQVDQKLTIPAGPIPVGPDGKPVPTNTPTPKNAIYKVEARAGDTLESIAKRLGATVDAIVAANDWIDNADVILIPGDLVIVPVGQAALSPTTLRNSGPKATAAPTPTPTPGTRWPAPQLLHPLGDVEVEGAVLLQWLSVGTLAADEVYVVRVAPEGRLRDELVDVTKSTSYRVAADWLARHGRTGARLLWQVQVARDVRAVAGQAAGLRASSAVSSMGLFTWQEPATEAPTPQR